MSICRVDFLRGFRRTHGVPAPDVPSRGGTCMRAYTLSTFRVSKYPTSSRIIVSHFSFVSEGELSGSDGEGFSGGVSLPSLRGMQLTWGRQKEKVLPLPSVLTRESCPPIFSINRLEMAKLSPVPLLLV